MNNTENKNKKSGWELIYLANNGKMETLFLPEASEGTYTFTGEIGDQLQKHLSLKMHKNNWIIRSTSPVRLIIGETGVTATYLKDETMITATDRNSKAVVIIREKYLRDEVFHNYVVSDPSIITIGRKDTNGLQYNCKYISSNHAAIQYQSGNWKIVDNNSSNGTYVNGRRIKEKQLHLGDVVDFFGRKLIVGSGFISINDLDSKTSIRTRKLTPITQEILRTKLSSPPPKTSVKKEELYFNRSPRKRVALDPKEINIEAPPPSLRDNEIPLLLRMGGSAGGMLTSLLMGNYLSLISTMLFPILHRGYSDKQRKEYEEKRLRIYSQYLRNKEQEIQDEVVKEVRVLNKNYPSLNTVLHYTEATEHLWERRNRDDDFLTIRIGSGKIPMMAEIQHPRDLFSLEKDPLEEKMLSLAQTTFYLQNVPILHSFMDHFVTGVIGEEFQRKDFFYHILLQMVLLHSYDEVKTVFLFSPEDLREMSFIRILPHTWNDQKTMRFIAVSESEAFRIGEYLKEQLEEDLNQAPDLKRILQKRPYYVVFALNRKLLESMEILKEIMALDTSVGVSIIAFFNEVPKDCSVVFSLNKEGKHQLKHIREIEKEDQEFCLDNYDSDYAGKSIKKMSNLNLRTVTVDSVLPRMLSFLEMFHVGTIESLNIMKRWKENNPVKTLAVPVGVNIDGSDFMLDLHEKYQGPHGLVAGTTGSGKSEFLITYILSLAVNFSPDEVAFVLIDYKGGGLAGAFEDARNGIRLPHLQGTITNLDGSAIARSLTSLHSEMTRRQRRFNEAKSKTGEGTMDIYNYQRLYRIGEVSEPMAHLFIISDEFAELRQQQPEFLNELVSIARIGRSLGVHLILATQKPGSVVTDQIVSNSKFKVCLKVQDKSDSMEMLKRPEAGELRETGRFYLQVGNNELFVLGQSAWSGALYEPQETIVTKRDDSLQFIDHLGSQILEIKPEIKKLSTGRSQLVMVVREVIRIAEEIGIKPHSLWLPVLPDKIDAIRLENEVQSVKNGLFTYCAGRLDDPMNQAQYLLHLNLEKSGHLLVMGETGSGKTTFIQTMLAILSQKYPPEDLNYYILDYSSRLMRLFDKLPHCGGVLGEEQEGELNNFFRTIQGIIDERKRQFASLEVDSYESARKIVSIPYVLVVIDNIAGMRFSKTGEMYFNILQTYMKQAGNYGVAFVITSSHLNEVPSRIRQEFGERISLQMKDRYEYFELLGCRVNYEPPKKNGRGLYRYNDRPLEMQLSMFGADVQDEERIPLLKEHIDRIYALYLNHTRARRLPMIPEGETFAEFSQKFGSWRIPLGYAIPDGQPVQLPLKQMKNLPVYLGNPDSTIPFFNNLLYTAKTQEMNVIFAKRKDGNLLPFLRDNDFVESFTCTKEGYNNLAKRVCKDIAERYPVLEAFCKENGLDIENPDIYNNAYDYMRTKYKPVLVIVEDTDDLCQITNEDTETLKGIGSALQIGRQFLIFFVLFWYPDKTKSLNQSQLYKHKLIGYEKTKLLLGGALKKQSLLQLPMSVNVTEKPGPFNRGLMYYRDEFYTLQFPMEEIKTDIPEDDRHIFQ